MGILVAANTPKFGLTTPETFACRSQFLAQEGLQDSFKASSFPCRFSDHKHSSTVKDAVKEATRIYAKFRRRWD